MEIPSPLSQTPAFRSLKDTTVFNQHRSAVPERLPEIEGLRFTASAFAARSGGVGYNVLPLGDDETAFLFFRVVPGDIPGDYITAMCNMAFRFHLRPGISAGEALKRVNASLSESIFSLHCITCFLGILDMRTHLFRFSCAGHAPLLRSNGGSSGPEPLVTPGKPLGIFEGAAFTEKSVLLKTGDALSLEAENAYAFRCDIISPPSEEAVLEACGLPKGDYTMRTLHDFDQMMTVIHEMVDGADRMGYPIKFQKNLRLVLLELLTNAILHGNKSNPSKKVRTVSRIEPRSVLFGVIDEGEGYDDKKIPDPLAPENISRQQGRGIFIVKHYTDEFSLRGRGNCTVVRLIRNSPRAVKA